MRRRKARKEKAARLGVRPINLLRPAVRGQTIRYNRKLREGRGFTLAELKEAGIGRKEARGVGIIVDHRRRNLSEEGKQLNVERLKEYKTRLIVFPRKAGKPKKGDSSVSAAERISTYMLNWKQPEELKAATTRSTLPLPEAYPAEVPRKITDEERAFDAYKTLRTTRAHQRHEGARKIRAAKVSACTFRISFVSDMLFSGRRKKRRRKSKRASYLPRYNHLLLQNVGATYELPCTTLHAICNAFKILWVVYAAIKADI